MYHTQETSKNTLGGNISFSTLNWTSWSYHRKWNSTKAAQCNKFCDKIQIWQHWFLCWCKPQCQRSWRGRVCHADHITTAREGARGISHGVGCANNCWPGTFTASWDLLVPVQLVETSLFQLSPGRKPKGHFHRWCTRAKRLVSKGGRG